MNIKFQNVIPKDFHENSHVWVYQSNRTFTIQEELQIKHSVRNFIKNWKNHDKPLKSYTNLFYGQFIIFMIDENGFTIPSLFTNSLIRLIKNIEDDFQVELFDRQMLAFIVQERIQLLPLIKLNPAIEKDFITLETFYFNNTILTKKELLTSWIIPVKESWLANRFYEINNTEE